jgi:putative peptidoglycan binding protein
MHKIRSIGIALLIAAALAMPLLASAQTVTTLEQQLQALLTEITALQQSGVTTVTQPVAAQPTVTSSTDTDIICPNLIRTLSLGSTGTDVANLQGFLAQNPLIYPEGTVTAYFGTLTQDAVQRWQSVYGIVSSGSPATTGYGVVGPRTRAAIAASCADHSGTTSTMSSPSSITMPASQQPLCPVAPEPVTSCLGTWSPITNATGCTIAWQCSVTVPGLVATSTAAAQATTAAATASASACAAYTLPLCTGGSDQWLGINSEGCNLGYQCTHPGSAQ